MQIDPFGRRGTDDAGFTLIEVMIASAIMLIATTMIFGILASLQRTDRRTQALVSNEQDVRFVQTEILRDLRAANPLLAFSNTATDYKTRVEMMIGPLAGPQQRVRWVYDTNTASSSYETIKRELLSADGSTVNSSTVRLRNVRNDKRGVDLFTFRSQSGTDLVAAGNGGNVGNCAVNVEVVITADSDPGPEPFTVKADSEIRNRLPGGLACG